MSNKKIQTKKKKNDNIACVFNNNNTDFEEGNCSLLWRWRTDKMEEVVIIRQNKSLAWAVLSSGSGSGSAWVAFWGRVDIYTVDLEFFWFPVIEAIFNWGRFQLSTTRVDLQLLESQFSMFPAFPLLFRVGGWVWTWGGVALKQFCQILIFISQNIFNLIYIFKHRNIVSFYRAFKRKLDIYFLLPLYLSSTTSKPYNSCFDLITHN